MTAMATVAVIGEAVRVTGFQLAGALVFPAEDAEAARTAWRALGPDVAVVILTPKAAIAVGEVSGGPLTVVMPA
ncbi:V-type ATP synthase subunit F [Streptosporangium roseum]|uniref:V-type ATP synthase subunit F n=1 Tax=Streptosporangium roseum TaxID=2001 RepID=UPI0018CC6C90|nr:V-type ATP synthase subunit F [Streptosporangium roseum]